MPPTLDGNSPETPFLRLTLESLGRDSDADSVCLQNVRGCSLGSKLGTDSPMESSMPEGIKTTREKHEFGAPRQTLWHSAHAGIRSLLFCLLAFATLLLTGCPKSQPYLISSPNGPSGFLKPYSPGAPVSVAPPPALAPATLSPATLPPGLASQDPSSARGIAGPPPATSSSFWGFGSSATGVPASAPTAAGNTAGESASSLAYAAQIAELERRTRILDENNRQLYGQLGQAQQQTQVQRERADLMQRQLGDLSTQLQQARLALTAPAKNASDPKAASSYASNSPAPPRSNARLTANTSSGVTKPGSEAQIVAALKSLGYPLDTDGTSLRLRIPSDQLFQPNSTQWTASASPLLDRVAEALQTGGSVSRIAIESHTDAAVAGQMGEQIAAEAQRITDAQANAILQYWRDRGAFGPGQLTARPAGSAQPIMDNQTPVGRATNRRIEFTLSGFR